MRRIGVVAATFALVISLLAACNPFGPDPNIQPANTPLRLAFAYPWFPSAWNQQGIDPFTHYHPSDGFYSSTDFGEARTQAWQMSQAGLEGAIQSWWGQGTVTDRALQVQLDGAHGTPFKETIYYEPEGQGDPSSTQIGTDLQYLSRYASDPSWLKIDGKPAIFVYADPNDGCGMADRWAAAPGRQDWYVVLKVFPGYSSCAHQPDEWHQYGPASRTDQQGKHSFTVSPGYWKANETAPRLARDLNAWRAAVQQMAASGAHLQLVTTWNEWGEGTSVQPATEWGTSYLDVLRDVLMGGSPSTTTTTVATTTSSTTTPTTTPTSTTTTVPVAGSYCGKPGPAPARYAHVVEVWMENKSYSQVIGSSSAPYETGLARECATFTRYATVGSPSEPNYVGATSGSTFGISDDGSHPLNQDNLFRQVRVAGGTAREYHDGASSPCTVGSGNASKHEPRLGNFNLGVDTASCSAEVLPLSSLNPNALPTFAFVTPTLCNDTHDCSVATGDNWLKTHLAAILNGSDYQSGNTLVILVHDEYTDLPNVFIAPTAHGAPTLAVNHFAMLRTVEDKLGLPCLLNACSAPDMGVAGNL